MAVTDFICYRLNVSICGYNYAYSSTLNNTITALAILTPSTSTRPTEWPKGSGATYINSCG